MEYKCLPSGLHSVKEDLVYFVHGSYAAISAFVQEEADESHRNANFVAVGALVPLSEGRLGRAWLLAADLRQLAKDAVRNAQDRSGLELFWTKHMKNETPRKDKIASPSAVKETSLPPSLDRKRKRARSDASASAPNAQGVFTRDHPALLVPELLDVFGPLLFPLYRAALLRKRILLLGSPPVQRSCNFVYMLSIFSGISQSLTDLIQPDTEPLFRIQTLFNVGIHDIPLLSDLRREGRWLACTTDDILGEKKDLYDLLVKLPSTQTTSGGTKQWPQISTVDGALLKATQRDLRRFRLLRSELRRSTGRSRSPKGYRDDLDDGDYDDSPLMRASTTTLLNEVKSSEPGDNTVVEPVTWTAMAYNGFMWWASAGEMEAWEADEARADRELLDEVPDVGDLMRHTSGASEVDTSDTEQKDVALASAEATVVTAYFHRLTSALLHPLSSLVEDADDETEEGIADSNIEISVDNVRAMGLDTWSVADREFVIEAVRLYFGREARIEDGGTKVCGVRIC